jgi:ABC-type nitrate/sulfonate/bicarbonate transport system permease component
MRTTVYSITGVALVFFIWILLTRIYPPAIIPPLGDIFQSLGGILGDDRFFYDLSGTMLRVAGSFFIALMAGILAGIVAGVWTPMAETLHPIMVMAESAPPMAWLVMAILLFGMGHGPALLVGLSAAIPIFFFNTVVAVRSLDGHLIEMAHSFNVSRRGIFRSIYLPGILLSVIGASSSSLSIIWRVVIMAEAFTTARGLGPQLWGSYLYGDSAIVYAYILIIVFLGFTLEFGLIKPAAGLIKKKLRVVRDEQ